MTTPPTGDPKPQPPAWAPYPADPLGVWTPTVTHALSAPQTAPDARWYALDGWAVPGPVWARLAVWGEVWRQALFGPVERCGLYAFPGVGARTVVQMEKACLVWLPEYTGGWDVQGVRPDAEAAIRALPALPPLPGAPPVV